MPFSSSFIIHFLYDRFSAHLKESEPSELSQYSGGILYLVLPLRWISQCFCGSCPKVANTSCYFSHSENTDNEEGGSIKAESSSSFCAFLLFLKSLGLIEVADRKITPKLVFFVLGRASRIKFDKKKNMYKDNCVITNMWIKYTNHDSIENILKNSLDFKREIGKLPFCYCHLREDLAPTKCSCKKIICLPVVMPSILK